MSDSFTTNAKLRTNRILVSPPRVERWLRAQLKAEHIEELFAAIERMNATTTPPAMSPDEVAQEIAAMRAERRAPSAR